MNNKNVKLNIVSGYGFSNMDCGTNYNVHSVRLSKTQAKKLVNKAKNNDGVELGKIDIKNRKIMNMFDIRATATRIPQVEGALYLAITPLGRKGTPEHEITCYTVLAVSTDKNYNLKVVLNNIGINYENNNTKTNRVVICNKLSAQMLNNNNIRIAKIQKHNFDKAEKIATDVYYGHSKSVKRDNVYLNKGDVVYFNDTPTNRNPSGTGYWKGTVF